MSWAVTGPIPSIVSSSSTVAVPRLIGPSAEAPAVTASAARAGLGDHDLLAVGQARCEVDCVERRLRARSAGPLHGVGDPGAGR